ncbi:MAG: pseudouridine synthase [Lachnospiraceae bacterium]|nr:rRNA pseudouridine synthase [Clostridiales bacterium]MDD6293333.1 pseudouridine synthase [Eubacteriales bacterium]MDY2607272.1 pseudouridine synthase [Lachnospiraceae bacterium]
MSKVMRLDKFLSEMGIASRKETREYAKKGRIKVNNAIVKVSDYKIDAEKDIVTFDGRTIAYEQFEYYMLNKPAGVVSATVDNNDRTVIDLIDSERKKDLFPVGRLDKDTVGLLIITNDGELAHSLLSPVKHIDKKYFARVEGIITEEHIKRFKEGLKLKDGTLTKPAQLEIIKSGNVKSDNAKSDNPKSENEKSSNISEVEITICEGKYHQIKRMIACVGGKVIYLKRLSMGRLELDENLREGEYRRLTEDEIKCLRNGEQCEK